jgi:hypothetical protein
MSNNHDWILASNLDGKRIGFVPINHIKLEKKITSKTNSNDLQRKTSSSSFQSQKSISDLSSAECYKSEWEAIFSNLKDLSRC